MKNSIRTILSEFLGTFFLVFCGTGAMVINQTSGGNITNTGIGLTFGLIVMAMIFVFGDISGAHLNPAVTLAFSIINRFPYSKLPFYMLSQLAGGAAASLLLRILFPEQELLGNTLPSGSPLQSFVFEIILSTLLILVILSVSTGSKEKGLFAAIAIGGTVALEAIFAGPVCGASMNPARSLGPALATLNFNAIWIYLAAPFIGSFLAKYAYRFTHEKKTIIE